jgi:hypothetical protein
MTPAIERVGRGYDGSGYLSAFTRAAKRDL